MKFIDDINSFLESEGFECSHHMREGFDVIIARTADGKQARSILPLEISASTPKEAETVSEKAEECIRHIRNAEGYPLIITEDRWKRQRQMMEARLLAHLNRFDSVFARNCEVRKIDKETARYFLGTCHSYGYAACRYHYGLFDKKGGADRLTAVATFSNARRWIKEGKEIRSYEWTRYASLPEARIIGGMGKLLKAFIKEVHPDDIMSYADLEWSEGDVYIQLGFRCEGYKEPVMFASDQETWSRKAIRHDETVIRDEFRHNMRFFRNFGSNKYRLKLTDYE